MKTNFAFIQAAVCLLLAVCSPLPLLADVPEPDYILYGQITFGTNVVTAAEREVIVEARSTPSGPIIAGYAMGSETNFGNFYSLRLPLEAFLPLARLDASRVGALVYLTVRDASGVRVQKTTSIASRGKLVRFDFVELDSDADGLPDRWEQQYFGSATAGDPNGDPDGDGRSNLQEYLDSTNPLLADGRHPADVAPSDNQLAFEEVDAYSLAWLMGASWPTGPTNIPISFVTRAAALWASGGHYVFTNAPPTNAPMWWVSWPPGSPAATTNASQITSLMTNALPESQPMMVTLVVTPADSVQAQAVEDGIPSGWTVRDISHGGNYDEVHNKVKWGPFYDSGQRELYYQLSPPLDANGTNLFTGVGSFDGFNVLISGVRQVSVGSTPSNIVPRFVAWAIDGSGPAFILNGAPSQDYQVEVSTNLATWSLQGVIHTDDAGQYTLRPDDPGHSPHRFYRLRIP